ncbi:U32 family peptidase [Desulfurobacterium sp.]
MELLLPAGGLRHVFAAFDYGADACYLGIGSLNARAGAQNFTVEDYRKAVNFARQRKKKIYLTFNTLLKNCELDSVFKTIDAIYDLQPDGIIVQDIGLASMIKRDFPKIPLIASTQMGFHNVSGVKFAEDFGFKRVILSRELTLKEIETIRAASSVELEVFIHGAICFSFSGYCFASSFIGGNSGNRGRCSQVCRMLFDGDFNGFIFNLKDLAGFDFVKSLHDIGVDSLKIEGRLKDELYVAVNSFVYRKFLDEASGKIRLETEEKEKLKKLSTIVYSRKQWAGYFASDHPEDCIDASFPGNYGLFIGRVKKSWKGAVLLDNFSFPLGRHDGVLIFSGKTPIPAKIVAVEGRKIFLSKVKRIKAGSSVFLVHSAKVQNQFPVKSYNVKPAVPEIHLFIELSDKVLNLKAFNPVRRVWKSLSFPVYTEPAKNQAVDVDTIRAEFKKSSRFGFSAVVKHVNVPEGIFIRKSELSSVRKTAFSLIQKDLFPLKKYRFPDVRIPGVQRYRPDAIFVVDDKNVESFLKFSRRFKGNFVVFLKTRALETVTRFKLAGLRTGIVFPLILKTYEEQKFLSFLNSAVDAGVRDFMISHYYGLKIAERFKDVRVFGRYTLYTLNLESVIALKKKVDFLTVSVEDDLENINAISKGVDIITIYQNTPLFLSQTCLKKIFKECPESYKECSEAYRITKKTGKYRDSFTVSFERCRTILFGNKPLNLNRLKDRLPPLVPEFDFTLTRHSPERMRKIYSGDFVSGHVANLLRGLK